MQYTTYKESGARSFSDKLAAAAVLLLLATLFSLDFLRGRPLVYRFRRFRRFSCLHVFFFLLSLGFCGIKNRVCGRLEDHGLGRYLVHLDFDFIVFCLIGRVLVEHVIIHVLGLLAHWVAAGFTELVAKILLFIFHRRNEAPIVVNIGHPDFQLPSNYHLPSHLYHMCRCAIHSTHLVGAHSLQLPQARTEPEQGQRKVDLASWI
mmetsp:Transcript_22853/g.40501  ORF Transcript_22853/g.40501 Transcript_22853/m.40501 type:complete len:205 (+) Transcript_22853:308-922(+)